MQVTTRGLIVRERTSGDDRLLTILTDDCGVVHAVARGANKPRSRLTSSTELFCYSRVVLFRYRDSTTVDSAEVEESFFELRKDLTALALASYIAELCCEMAPREEPAPDYLRLTLNCLHLLRTHKRPAAQLKATYELRLISMAGYMPDLTGCAGCGAFEDKPLLFSVSSGELYCEECRREGQHLTPLPGGVLAAMRHILYCEAEKLFSFTLPGEAIHLLGEICEQYMLCHVQRSFKSLEFYHSVAGM